ncbi:hypothetical protein TK90_2859 (plasmid) [Thioalkalivibrio sp. K90mix]|uniref:hypothetical protein n=1 Tax=Thioalkalivibrio sp. (strain K90mix) TaxID=396595 RepID=UPI000195A8CE|nr:hypothetical protein [Thioalkalivibrio sp. K90mix]ADC73343.1 hypothetical protein TK90_2859 [Thioalkalivibrio sp. K90mix]
MINLFLVVFSIGLTAASGWFAASYIDFGAIHEHRLEQEIKTGVHAYSDALVTLDRLGKQPTADKGAIEAELGVQTPILSRGEWSMGLVESEIWLCVTLNEPASRVFERVERTFPQGATRRGLDCNGEEGHEDRVLAVTMATEDRVVRF